MDPAIGALPTGRDAVIVWAKVRKQPGGKRVLAGPLRRELRKLWPTFSATITERHLSVVSFCQDMII